MTGDDEGPLARWSRRKQAARAPEAAPSPPEREAPPAIVEETVPPEALPPEALPSLDDLTVGSDLAAFLRKGVPEALKRAALRKMWSLDPAIRDHVGLSENAWDFNDPASIPGFGPAAKALVKPDFLSRGRLKLDRPEPADSPPREVPPPEPEQPEPEAEEEAAVEEASEKSPDPRPAPARHGGALPRED
ncbi:DUF3306 domain-containing protein [Inquilinus sp. CAU 1745]|uniref:DUF3306 domain-containing protein n=1 Tax=Inquilinus sp. CAU 1745 TaxID=3140369 RepID=UPI00325B7484